MIAIFQACSLLVWCILLLSGPQQSKCEDMVDITKGLSDKEINNALEELSLDDLKQLEQAVCGNDYARVPQIPKQNSIDQESYMNADQFAMSSGFERKLRKAFSPESTHSKLIVSNNPRPKRNIVPPASFVDDNYIKQLDYSFPGTVQFNDENEYMEMKRDHIRVKRN